MRDSPPASWHAAVDRFLGALRASGLRDRAVLATLLTDLLEELPGEELDAPPVPPSDAAGPANHDHPVDQCERRLTAWLAAARSPEPPAVAHVRQIKQFLDQHYAEPITLERLAMVVGREKGYLATLFRKSMGCPVREYLMRVRVRHATELIRQGIKIEAAMLTVGFRGKRNFYVQFVRTTGHRPGMYRPGCIASS